MRRLRAATLALLPTAVALVAMAAPAHAASVGGLGVRPTHSDPADPATKAYFKPMLAPGSSFSDAVTVSNTADAPMTVFVTPVDGVTSATSGAVYRNRQDTVSETGRWVSVQTSTATVPAHSTLDLPFTIDVPADAVPGDHLAGLAVEDANPHTSGGNFSVTEVIRAVVGIDIRVPGVAAFSVAPGTPTLAQMPGTADAAVTVPLAGTGGLLGKPTLSVELDGNGYSRTVERKLDTILPGDHIDYPFVWPDDLAAGEYRIHVRVTGGDTVASSSGTSRLGTGLDGAANTGADKHVTIKEVGGARSTGLTVGIGFAAVLIVVVGGRARRAWALRPAG